MGGGGRVPGGVVISQTTPSKSPAARAGQPSVPCGEGAFRACRLVPGNQVKLDIIWLQRKWLGRPKQPQAFL